MRRLVAYISALLSARNLIGSDIAIVLTCFQHVWEGSSFLATADANGSIGMAALLLVFSSPYLTAGLLLASVAAATAAEWFPDLSSISRAWLLLPQFVLLLIEAFWALHFVTAQHYADGVPRPWNFIFCDQMSRLGMPVWYAAAMVARVKD